MGDRIAGLAWEEGIEVTESAVTALVRSDEMRRAAAYSAYGYWLMRRLDGDTDGPAVLALWRETAWTRTGSPIQGFRLRCEDFIDAEEAIADALRSVVVSGSS